MTDDHTFDMGDDGDDPLARIRARFQEASERILSGTDDDLVTTEPAEHPQVEEPLSPLSSPVSTLQTGEPGLDDFGEIDIQDDARFSLDFEHGVSGSEALAPPAYSPVAHTIDSVDLLANLALVREEAPEHSVPAIDESRHAKHRTRGRVEPAKPAPDAPEPTEEAEPTAPSADVEAAARPKAKKPKSSKKHMKPEPVESPRRPQREDAAAARPKGGDAGSVPAKRSRVPLAIAAVVLLAAGGAAAFVLTSTSGSTEPPDSTVAATTIFTTVPPTPTEEAAAALEAFGFSGITVSVDEEGTAEITGQVKNVRERDLAIDVVAGVDGVVTVSTNITYDVGRGVGQVQDDISAIELTVDHDVTMAYFEGIVTITGIVPESAIESGELGNGGTLENRLLDVSGVEEVRFELTLQGDPTRLQNRITALLTGSPLVFDPETGADPVNLKATLDAVVRFMDDEPGLTIQVAVRGDDVEETLQLAEQRRDDVIDYLTGAGLESRFVQTVLVETLDPAILELESEILIAVVKP